jgi:hypothetical protein
MADSLWARFVFGLVFARGYVVLVYDLLAARPPGSNRERIHGGSRSMTPTAMVTTAVLLCAFVGAAGTYGLLYCIARKRNHEILRTSGYLSYAALCLTLDGKFSVGASQST